MKKEDINTYIRLHKEIETIAENIYYYVKDNYKEWLSFYRTLFSGFNFSGNYLIITYEDYYDEICCDELPSIPIDRLDNKNSWKLYLDGYYAEEAKKKENAAIRKKEEIIEEEKQLLKKLKEKYETF